MTRREDHDADDKKKPKAGAKKGGKPKKKGKK